MFDPSQADVRKFFCELWKKHITQLPLTPLEAMALIGLGIDRLSITPAAVGPVKAMILSLDAGALRAAMQGMLTAKCRNLRAPLIEWAAQNQVEIA